MAGNDEAGEGARQQGEKQGKEGCNSSIYSRKLILICSSGLKNDFQILAN